MSLTVVALAAAAALALWSPGADPHAARSGAATCGLSFVHGDFDGDGRRDRATVSAKLPRGALCRRTTASRRFRVTIVPARGARMTRSLAREPTGWTTPACAAGCAAFAAPDLDADGRDELAIELDHGASQITFGVFRVARGRIVRIHRADGSPLAFNFYGSLCCASDVVCRTESAGARLVVAVSAGHDQRRVYWSERIFRFDGRTFRFRARRERTVPLARGFPPRVPGQRCVKPSGIVAGPQPS